MMSCPPAVAAAIFAALVLLISPAVSAQSPSCDSPQGSGACLPWGLVDLQSELPGEIVDLSKDGSVVVGEVSLAGVYRWKLGVGVTILDLPGTEAVALGRNVMSADGSIVVGDTRPSGPSSQRIFRWEADQGASVAPLLSMGSAVAIPNVFPSETNGDILPTGLASVSADGNTIVGVGEARNSMGTVIDQSWIFRWTMAGGTTDIPQLAFPFDTGTSTPRRFTPYSIAGDGITIVGEESSATVGLEAVSWVPDAGPSGGIRTNLGNDPGFPSRAIAASFDGQVIAGFSPNVGGGASNGFRWTQSGGEELLPVVVVPKSMSDDGDLIASLKPRVSAGGVDQRGQRGRERWVARLS